MPIISGSGGVGGGGITFLATSAPSGAATVTFSSLVPGSYTSFYLTWLLCTTNAADQNLCVQVNGDSTAGHYGWTFTDATANTSDTSAHVGWLPASTQSFGSGAAFIPAQHGGATRNGSSTYGENGTLGFKQGAGSQSYSNLIAANVTSITLLAAAGNLTGNVTLWGVQ